MANFEDEDYEPFMNVPAHLCKRPALSDQHTTATSQLQERTIDECLPLLNAINSPRFNPFDFDSFGLPFLQRSAHVEFVHDGFRGLPSGFVAMDASRPWLMYWSLLSLYVMGEDVSNFQSRIVETFKPLQNPSGGFGGGQGHLSHLAGTYAVILSVAMVGGEEAYGMIDRKALWHWLGQLKQTDGGFRVCQDGEEDVRGAYCALVAITLLDLPYDLPEDAPARVEGMTDFRDGLGEYLSRCQTFEGGIGASPSNEAHGAYAFCALACLSILGHPTQTIPQYLDVQALLRWLSARQYAPEGGFAGRTNKVVDGCYSHWIGGCWPLTEVVLDGVARDNKTWEDINDGRIFSGEGLVRYILNCCQADGGGLRDKPSKRPDAYHTCYNLAGLSMARFRQYYNEQSSTWTVRRNQLFRQADANSIESDETDQEVAAFHPVYVIPHQAVDNLRSWSLSRNIDFHQENGI